MPCDEVGLDKARAHPEPHSCACTLLARFLFVRSLGFARWVGNKCLGAKLLSKSIAGRIVSSQAQAPHCGGRGVLRSLIFTGLASGGIFTLE